MTPAITAELAGLRRIQRGGQGSGGVADDDLIHVLINANAAGDNSIINPPGQRFGIVELVLLNGPSAQTIILKDGQVPLMQKTNWGIEQGLFFGPAGTGEPHFKVSAGNGFNLFLSLGSLVEGFVKYRIIP